MADESVATELETSTAPAEALQEERTAPAPLADRVKAESYRTAILRDQAVAAGLIEPTDDMSPTEWARAFQARQARADGGTLPESEAGENAALAEPEPDETTQRDQELLNNYRSRAAIFTADHPDFDDVIGQLQLSDEIAPGIELALLTLGPEVAYAVASDPDFLSELNSLPQAAAVARVGAKAAQIAQRGEAYDSTARDFLGVEISPDAMASFQSRARELQKQEPLTDEELAIAHAVSVAPHVSRAILAMDAPELALHLARNPSLAGKLNQLHPLAAAGELHQIRADLQREAAARGERRGRLPAPITPTRKSSPTDSGLSDNLSTEVWARRFKKRMHYDEG